jgi:hypothetical protein
LHLVAIARVAGIVIDWDDFGEWLGSTPDEKAGRICFREQIDPWWAHLPEYRLPGWRLALRLGP